MSLLDELLNAGGIAPPSASSSQAQQCVDQANVIQAPADARTTDIAKNWNPSGQFSIEDIRGVVSAVQSVLQKAQSALDQAANEPGGIQDQIQNETDILAKHFAQSTDYLDAANQAESMGSGTVVNAPSFKQWVINALNESSNAMTVAYVAGCTRPWWLDALNAYQQAFDQAWSVVTAVVGAVGALVTASVNAVETTVTAATGIAKVIAWLAKYWWLVGIGLLGGAWVVHRHRKGLPILPSRSLKGLGREDGDIIDAEWAEVIE